MAVTLDRVVGLLALFLLAWAACLPAWESLRDMSGGSALFGTLTIVCMAGLSGLRLLGSRKARNSQRLDRAVHRLPWGANLWEIAGAFHAMRMQRGRFWAVVGLSVINHLISCLALFCICRAMGLEVGFLKGLIVFPIAIFSNVFGIAGGFGLGTFGFDILFSRFFCIFGKSEAKKRDGPSHDTWPPPEMTKYCASSYSSPSPLLPFLQRRFLPRSGAARRSH